MVTPLRPRRPGPPPGPRHRPESSRPLPGQTGADQEPVSARLGAPGHPGTAARDRLATAPDLEERLRDEIHQIEQEAHMRYVTSFERIGIRKGMEKGMARGMEKGIEKGIEKNRRKPIIL